MSFGSRHPKRYLSVFDAKLEKKFSSQKNKLVVAAFVVVLAAIGILTSHADAPYALAFLGPILETAGGILNGILNRNESRRNQEMNLAQQREFAQNGIRWRVADARAAGVHPLFALGANTTSFTPQSVGETDYGLDKAGQNISRAIQAGQTRGERDAADAATALQLEKTGLENELLRTQISSLRQKQLGPAMPALGPTPSGFPVKTDDIKQQPDVTPETAQTRFLGVPLKTNPWMMDAETTENRYGNLPENVQGLMNLPADAVYTLWHRWPEIRGFLAKQYGDVLNGGRQVRDYIRGR